MGMSETYGYNAAGNPTSRKDFNGKTTVYAYDSMNQLLSTTPDPSFASVPGFPSSTFSAPITFTYTATGQRASMTDPSGTTTYSYDSRNRLVSKATPEGTLTYSYDSTGNVLSTLSSNVNGVNVAYTYDPLNRLATVTDNPPLSGNRQGTGTTTYAYDAVGNLSGYLYPNGVQTSYVYNTLNRLTNMTVAKGTGPNATNLASYAYTLTLAGNRTSVVELSGRTVNYGYDDIHRLTSEVISNDPTTANDGSVNYSFDAVGNRLTRNSTIPSVPSTTSTYNANDQLGGDTYDANGSTTSSTGGAYVYDFENHIIAVNPGSPNAISIIYDGDGNRVSKARNGVSTAYLIDENSPSGFAQVVEERVNGTIARTYTYGSSLISASQMLGHNWSSSFYGHDGHGSVRLLTDAGGIPSDTYDYEAFGSLINQVGATPNFYLYAGEEFDVDLGFYYLRSRYMNTATGRFFTADSIQADPEDPRESHLYAYAFANPVDNVDPSGFVPLWAPPLFPAAVGRAVEVVIFRDFTTGFSPKQRRTNVSITTILKARGIKPPLLYRLLGLLRRPDLVDLEKKLIYEIKPITRQNIGRYEQLDYLYSLNTYDPLGLWFYGNPLAYPAQIPPFSLTVGIYDIDVEVFPPDVYGVITYDWSFKGRVQPPPPVLVISLYFAAMMLDIMTQINRKAGNPSEALAP
jgi:RHS repeat-associated protein